METKDMKKRFAATLALATLGLAAPVSALDYDAAMRDYLKKELVSWAQESIIIDAISAQNSETAGLNAANILEMDQQWRSETSNGALGATIGPVMCAQVPYSSLRLNSTTRRCRFKGMSRSSSWTPTTRQSAL